MFCMGGIAVSRSRTLARSRTVSRSRAISDRVAQVGQRATQVGQRRPLRPVGPQQPGQEGAGMGSCLLDSEVSEQCPDLVRDKAGDRFPVEGGSKGAQQRKRQAGHRSSFRPGVNGLSAARMRRSHAYYTTFSSKSCCSRVFFATLKRFLCAFVTSVQYSGDNERIGHMNWVSFSSIGGEMSTRLGLSKWLGVGTIWPNSRTSRQEEHGGNYEHGITGHWPVAVHCHSATGT